MHYLFLAGLLVIGSADPKSLQNSEEVKYKSIAGIYRIVGQSPDGQKYFGMASVRHPKHDLIAVQWVLRRGGTFHGIGIKSGNSFAVAWESKGPNGEDRGITVYTLEGKNLKGSWSLVDLEGREVTRPTFEELRFLSVEEDEEL